MKSAGVSPHQPQLKFNFSDTVSLKLRRFKNILTRFQRYFHPKNNLPCKKNFYYYNNKAIDWKYKQADGTRLDQYAKLQAQIFMFLSFLDINHSNLLQLSRIIFSNKCFNNIDAFSIRCSQIFKLSNPFFPLIFLALSSYALNKNHQKGTQLHRKITLVSKQPNSKIDSQKVEEVLSSLNNHLAKIPSKQAKKFEAALKKAKKLTENFSKLFIQHSKLIKAYIVNNNSEKIYIKISKCVIKCLFETYDIYVNYQIICQQKNWEKYFNFCESNNYKIPEQFKADIETQIYNDLMTLNGDLNFTINELYGTLQDKHFVRSKELEEFTNLFFNSETQKIGSVDFNNSANLSQADIAIVNHASKTWIQFFEKFSMDFEKFLKKSLHKKYTVEHKLLKFNQKIRYAKICFNSFQAAVAFSLTDHKVSLIREICNVLTVDLAKKIHLFGFQFILIIAPNLGLKVFNNILILFVTFLYSRKLKPNEFSLRSYYLSLKINLLFFLLKIFSTISYIHLEVNSKIFLKFNSDQSNQEKILDTMKMKQSSEKTTLNFRQLILQAEEEIRKLRHQDITQIFNEAYSQIVSENGTRLENGQDSDFTTLFSDLCSTWQLQYLSPMTTNILSALEIDLKTCKGLAANNDHSNQIKERLKEDLIESFDKSEENFMPK